MADLNPKIRKSLLNWNGRKMTDKVRIPKPGPGAGFRKKPKVRKGVKVVNVPYPTSNSGVALSAPVSLPKTPWDNEKSKPEGE